MVTLYDAPAEELVDELAARLAERDAVSAPDWATFAKTGVDRELPPEQEDWWERRAASLLRKVAIDGPVGVQRLRSEYGSKKPGSNRYRVAPPRSSRGSGNVIRTCLQQLQEEGLVEEAGSEGRIASDEGRSLLDETAGDVLRDLDRPELERYV
ncbi:MAG: 30S ribosomal protein S19e [Halobacteriaceae archaeon]